MFAQEEGAELRTPDVEAGLPGADDWPSRTAVGEIEAEGGMDSLGHGWPGAEGAMGLCAVGKRRSDDEEEEEDSYVDFDDENDEDAADDDDEFYDDDLDEEDEDDEFDEFSEDEEEPSDE